MTEERQLSMGLVTTLHYTMTIEEIIKTLGEFIPFPEDDLEHDTEKFLYRVMEEWRKVPDRDKRFPSSSG